MVSVAVPRKGGYSDSTADFAILPIGGDWIQLSVPYRRLDQLEPCSLRLNPVAESFRAYLRCEVLGFDGAPLAGVPLRIGPVPHDHGDERVSASRSFYAQSGQAQILISPGEYRVSLDSAYCSLLMPYSRVEALVGSVATCRIVLPRSVLPCRIRVVSADGDVLGAMTCSVKDETGRSVAGYWSDASIEQPLLWLEPGAYRVVCRVIGYPAIESRWLLSNAVRELSVVVSRK